MASEPFAELACEPDPPVEDLALALAAEFAPVDAPAVHAHLDALGADVTDELTEPDPEPLAALAAVLGRRHGFTGQTREYDHPDNSMLPLVLAHRRGLPITLSVVYVAVARRAGVVLHGVGLPGHFVAGRFGAAGTPPELLDPFHGGVRIAVPELPARLVRPWGPHETALRMINNLVGSFSKRGALAHAIRAAELRLLLPVEPEDMERLTLEARALRARLN
jgi:regulator of sirC expression with transglutaminase-like and TPR domain